MKLEKDYELKIKDKKVIHSNTTEYYNSFNFTCLEFETFFDNFKAEKISVENGNFNKFNYRLDDDSDILSGIRI